jgi:hypothetical protein
MKATLFITVVIIAAITALDAMTTITAPTVFAQNGSLQMKQLINSCMYNNASTCRALEGNSSTTR